MRSRILFGSSLLHLLLTSLAPAGAAVIVVDTLADTDVVDGFCSLREAIVAAETNSSSGDCAAGSGASDRIRFSVTGTILLTSELPAIGKAVAFEGPGRDLLTVDGGDQFSILEFNTFAPTQFVVRDLSLAHGFASVFPASNGGCIRTVYPIDDLAVIDVAIRNCRATGNGGGIHAGGHLRLERVWLEANEAQATGGGGGGLVALGVANVEIVDSTFSGNFASGANASGGAMKLYVSGQVEMTGLTFSHNLSNERGGAIHFSGVGSNVFAATIRDSTFIDNESDVDETSNAATGGTLYLSNQTTSLLSVALTNTVLAKGRDNASPARCPEILVAAGDVPPVLTSAGFNLVADGTCVESEFPVSPGPGLPNVQGDFVGTQASPIDPRLDVLAANGGPTPTHLPLQESPHPVIDQGSCPQTARDQRGRGDAGTGMRAHDVPAVPDNLDGDGCDIGAVESQTQELLPPTVFVDGFESGSTLFWSEDIA